MSLRIDETVTSFSTMLKHGIATPNLINSNGQSDFLFNWLMLCSQLPDTCDVHIYNTLKMEDKASKDSSAVMGAFYLMEEPIYTWHFDKDGIVFCPLSAKYDLTFKEWKNIFLYDLRVQASLGYILHILKSEGDVSI